MDPFESAKEVSCELVKFVRGFKWDIWIFLFNDSAINNICKLTSHKL